MVAQQCIAYKIFKEVLLRFFSFSKNFTHKVLVLVFLLNSELLNGVFIQIYNNIG